jgi:DNA-binding MarR family transcriptional regulator
MNGQSCWRFLILSLGILLVCLPAQAAHAVQSGPSLSMSDHGAGINNVTPGLSAVNSPHIQGIAPANDAGTITASSSAQPTPDGKTHGREEIQSDTITGNIQSRSANTGAGSTSLSGPSQDSSGRPDSTDLERGGGSPQPTSWENAAGTSDSRGQNQAMGLMAGVLVSPGSAGSARTTTGSEGGDNPVPYNSPGSVPQQHRQGPPAQAGNYPCGPAQASPLPPATGQTRDESKEETPLRQRSKRFSFLSWSPEATVTGIPSSSPSTGLLFPLNMLLVGGYRRISKKNVLDHDARHEIYRAITEQPGIEVKTLTRITGINENTLRYHLDRLVAMGKISCIIRPGIVRYFQNQGVYSQYEHMMFHYLWSDTPRRILGMLYQHPGLTRQHVAEALTISGPSVTRQMDHLIEDGIVENRFPGRSNHYYLTAEAAQTITRLMNHSQVMAHSETESRAIPASAV